MKKIIITISILVISCYTLVCNAGAAVKLGVLAKNGPAKALKKWAATGEYLSQKIGQPVEIVPLGFDKVFPAVEAAEVDFFLVNSSMFITTKVKFGTSPIATMINSRQGKSLKSFGGVVFTTSYNDGINSFSDLKGKTFAAVKKSSFGGWQMAFKEFADAGIDPAKDFASLEFSGKHDNVVFAVQNEQVEAGTVRTDTLERMVASGAIAMEDFKIIENKDNADFPFVCSTKLYPEWPLGKLASTDNDLAIQVVTALKELQPGDKAAKNAKIVGWTDPLDYSDVETLQKSLGVGAYSKK